MAPTSPRYLRAATAPARRTTAGRGAAEPAALEVAPAAPRPPKQVEVVENGLEEGQGVLESEDSVLDARVRSFRKKVGVERSGLPPLAADTSPLVRELVELAAGEVRRLFRYTVKREVGNRQAYEPKVMERVERAVEDSLRAFSARLEDYAGIAIRSAAELQAHAAAQEVCEADAADAGALQKVSKTQLKRATTQVHELEGKIEQAETRDEALRTRFKELRRQYYLEVQQWKQRCSCLQMRLVNMLPSTDDDNFDDLDFPRLFDDVTFFNVNDFMDPEVREIFQARITEITVRHDTEMQVLNKTIQQLRTELSRSEQSKAEMKEDNNFLKERLKQEHEANVATKLRLSAAKGLSRPSINSGGTLGGAGARSAGHAGAAPGAAAGPLRRSEDAERQSLSAAPPGASSDAEHEGFSVSRLLSLQKGVDDGAVKLQALRDLHEQFTRRIHHAEGSDSQDHATAKMTMAKDMLGAICERVEDVRKTLEPVRTAKLIKSDLLPVDAQAELFEAKEAVERLQNQVSCLQIDKQHLARKYQAEKSAPAHLRQELKEVHAEISRRDNSLWQLDQKCNALQNELDAIKREREPLHAELEALRESRESLERQLSKEREAAEQLVEVLNEKKDRVEELGKALALKNKTHLKPQESEYAGRRRATSKNAKQELFDEFKELGSRTAQRRGRRVSKRGTSQRLATPSSGEEEAEQSAKAAEVAEDGQADGRLSASQRRVSKQPSMGGSDIDEAEFQAMLDGSDGDRISKMSSMFSSRPGMISKVLHLRILRSTVQSERRRWQALLPRCHSDGELLACGWWRRPPQRELLPQDHHESSDASAKPMPQAHSLESVLSAAEEEAACQRFMVLYESMGGARVARAEPQDPQEALERLYLRVLKLTTGLRNCQRDALDQHCGAFFFADAFHFKAHEFCRRYQAAEVRGKVAWELQRQALLQCQKFLAAVPEGHGLRIDAALLARTPDEALHLLDMDISRGCPNVKLQRIRRVRERAARAARRCVEEVSVLASQEAGALLVPQERLGRGAMERHLQSIGLGGLPLGEEARKDREGSPEAYTSEEGRRMEAGKEEAANTLATPLSTPTAKEPDPAVMEDLSCRLDQFRGTGVQRYLALKAQAWKTEDKDAAACAISRLEEISREEAETTASGSQGGSECNSEAGDSADEGAVPPEEAHHPDSAGPGTAGAEPAVSGATAQDAAPPAPKTSLRQHRKIRTDPSLHQRCSKRQSRRAKTNPEWQKTGGPSCLQASDEEPEKQEKEGMQKKDEKKDENREDKPEERQEEQQDEDEEEKHEETQEEQQEAKEEETEAEKDKSIEEAVNNNKEVVIEEVDTRMSLECLDWQLGDLKQRRTAVAPSKSKGMRMVRRTIWPEEYGEDDEGLESEAETEVNEADEAKEDDPQVAKRESRDSLPKARRRAVKGLNNAWESSRRRGTLMRMLEALQQGGPQQVGEVLAGTDEAMRHDIKEASSVFLECLKAQEAEEQSFNKMLAEGADMQGVLDLDLEEPPPKTAPQELSEVDRDAGTEIAKSFQAAIDVDKVVRKGRKGKLLAAREKTRTVEMTREVGVQAVQEKSRFKSQSVQTEAPVEPVQRDESTRRFQLRAGLASNLASNLAEELRGGLLLSLPERLDGSDRLPRRDRKCLTWATQASHDLTPAAIEAIEAVQNRPTVRRKDRSKFLSAGGESTESWGQEAREILQMEVDNWRLRERKRTASDETEEPPPSRPLTPAASRAASRPTSRTASRAATLSRTNSKSKFGDASGPGSRAGSRPTTARRMQVAVSPALPDAAASRPPTAASEAPPLAAASDVCASRPETAPLPPRQATAELGLADADGAQDAPGADDGSEGFSELGPHEDSEEHSDDEEHRSSILNKLVTEVVNISQQTEMQWDAVPQSLLTWLRLNLLQRQQAQFYCTSWVTTELPDFPGLSLSERDRWLKDFEHFLFNVMGLGRPQRALEQRRALRQTLREVPGVQGADNQGAKEVEEEARARMRSMTEQGKKESLIHIQSQGPVDERPITAPSGRQRSGAYGRRSGTSPRQTTLDSLNSSTADLASAGQRSEVPLLIRQMREAGEEEGTVTGVESSSATWASEAASEHLGAFDEVVEGKGLLPQANAGGQGKDAALSRLAGILGFDVGSGTLEGVQQDVYCLRYMSGKLPTVTTAATASAASTVRSLADAGGPKQPSPMNNPNRPALTSAGSELELLGSSLTGRSRFATEVSVAEIDSGPLPFDELDAPAMPRTPRTPAKTRARKVPPQERQLDEARRNQLLMQHLEAIRPYHGGHIPETVQELLTKLSFLECEATKHIASVVGEESEEGERPLANLGPLLHRVSLGCGTEAEASLNTQELSEQLAREGDAQQADKVGAVLERLQSCASQRQSAQRELLRFALDRLRRPRSGEGDLAAADGSSPRRRCASPPRQPAPAPQPAPQPAQPQQQPQLAVVAAALGPREEEPAPEAPHLARGPRPPGAAKEEVRVLIPASRETPRLPLVPQSEEFIGAVAWSYSQRPGAAGGGHGKPPSSAPAGSTGGLACFPPNEAVSRTPSSAPVAQPGSFGRPTTAPAETPLAAAENITMVPPLPDLSPQSSTSPCSGSGRGAGGKACPAKPRAASTSGDAAATSEADPAADTPTTVSVFARALARGQGRALPRKLQPGTAVMRSPMNGAQGRFR